MLHALTGLEQDKKRTAGGSGVGGVELAEILLHGTPLGKDLSRFFFIFISIGFVPVVFCRFISFGFLVSLLLLMLSLSLCRAARQAVAAVGARWLLSSGRSHAGCIEPLQAGYATHTLHSSPAQSRYSLAFLVVSFDYCYFFEQFLVFINFI